jgi:hypothetical protein
MPTSRRLFLAVTTAAFAALPLRAGSEIEAIDFETIPDGLRLAAAEITLAGDARVQGNLTITGNLTLGAGGTITFDPPRAGSLMVASGDFVPQRTTDSASNWEVGFHHRFAEPGAGLLEGVAPVHLPVGTEVTGLVCWFYDAAADLDMSGNVFLYGIAHPFAAETTHWMALASSAPRDSLIPFEVVGIEDTPLVVEAATAYQLYFGLFTTGPVTDEFDFRFFGCRIDYEISTWSP